MKSHFLSLIAAGFLVVSASAADAAMFGTQEDIHRYKIQDVEITSQEGDPLYLGYKVTTQYFIGGLYVHDDGYVFGVRDDSTKFIATSPEELKGFQDQGLLPTPLPAYSLSAFDYILGYSLWWVLAIVAIVWGIGWMRKRKAPATA